MAARERKSTQARETEIVGGGWRGRRKTARENERERGKKTGKEKGSQREKEREKTDSGFLLLFSSPSMKA